MIEAKPVPGLLSASLAEAPPEGRATSPVPPTGRATISAPGGAAASGGPRKTPGGGKPPYPGPAALPTQQGADGITFDFNQGCRVSLPAAAAGLVWQIVLRDLDSGNVLFRSSIKGGSVQSTRRWFVRFGLEVRLAPEEGGEGRVVLTHAYDASDRQVLIQFPVGTLGDTLAWIPYAAAFAEQHGCRLSCGLSGLIAPLLREAYPQIRFVTHEEIVAEALPGRCYATYNLGLFFDDRECRHQPTDFRLVGLHRTAAYILGVPPVDAPARIALADESRPIAEPYAVVAVQASTHAKMWNNPDGWRRLVAALKARGLRVICIDQKPVAGSGIVWSHMPHGVEDETGDRPLTERARWLRHAELFVGVSSGLAWLAYAAGCKVAMISGFTHPTNEFPTPFRVINWHACNSCWNDPQLRFDHKDHLWCPRHKDTPRQFECSRLITAEAAIAVALRAVAHLPPVPGAHLPPVAGAMPAGA